MAEVLKGWVILKSAKGRISFHSHNVQVDVTDNLSAMEIVGFLMMAKFQSAGFGYASKSDVEGDRYYSNYRESLIPFAVGDFWEIISLSERVDGKMEIRLKKLTGSDRQ